jgi:hypothetical protein
MHGGRVQCTDCSAHAIICCLTLDEAPDRLLGITDGMPAMLDPLEEFNGGDDKG